MSVASQPVPAINPGGYAALTAEVREFGLLNRRPVFYAGLLGVILLALVVSVAGLVVLHDTWWALLLAPVFAVVSTQIGFFGHDAAHRQISRRERTSRVLGLFSANLLNGLSYGWWLDKHNAHHAHPNDLDSDPDVRAGAVVFDKGQTVGRRGIAGWTTRHQAWLFVPMLTLEALNLHLASVLAVLRPGLRHRGVEAMLLSAHAAAYMSLLVVALTWQQALVFFLLHQAFFGVYLGCSFAPGHKGMPVLSPEQAADPLLRQVLTSRNVRGGRVTEMLIGGLNYQIEHHLFPSMPRPSLHRAQRIVQRFCEERGVSYAQATPVETYTAVLRHLDAVGADLRQS